MGDIRAVESSRLFQIGRRSKSDGISGEQSGSGRVEPGGERTGTEWAAEVTGE